MTLSPVSQFHGPLTRDRKSLMTGLMTGVRALRKRKSQLSSS